MGIVKMGPPAELIATLAEEFRVPNFIETGTYYGNTAVWASKIFESVYTIEYSSSLYEQAKEKYRDFNNIIFLSGDSRRELEKLINSVKQSTIFWLDAHWSGGSTYGQSDQCPLIEEIKIINSSTSDNYIFIDDARLFTSPPQPPHNIEQWPNIVEVLNALKNTEKPRYIVIIEDVIIAVPTFAKSTVSVYCQTVNSKLWQEYAKSNLEKGIDLIATYLKTKSTSLIKKGLTKK